MKKRNFLRVMTFRTWVILAIIVVVGAYAAYKFSNRDKTPDPRIAFGQCLTDKGATFYGAYWCPHCTTQKKALGKGFKNVNYVECGVPGNSRGQTQVCKDAGITGYPTWSFEDGSRLPGQQSLRSLADKTGCELPI